MSLEDSIQDVYRSMNAQLIVEIVNAIRFDPLRDMESFMRSILFAYSFGREHQIRLLYRQFATATRTEANEANEVNGNVDRININGMDVHGNGDNIHDIEEAYMDEAELVNGAIADTRSIDGFQASETGLANGDTTTHEETINGSHTEEEPTGLGEETAALSDISAILQELLIRNSSDVVVVRPLTRAWEFLGAWDASAGTRPSASFPNLRDAAQVDAE